MKDICLTFKITDDEYRDLDKNFTKLTYFAAHQLRKKNTRNNYTDEIEDISQELQLSILKAGSYYKRQVFIEKCLAACRENTSDPLILKIVDELQHLWDNRTRHGAGRQKFGKFQEKVLSRIVRQVVPAESRPRKKDKLRIDTKFRTYCKAIVWNTEKSMGKKITREKTLRSGMVSLSEFGHMGPGA